jgi:hypothetical protein
MLRRVALVRTYVSEELSTSFIRVTRIGELGTTLTVTSNRRTLRRNTRRCYIPSKRRFLQEPHGVTSQKTPSFIVTAVKTSNLTLSDIRFSYTLSQTPGCSLAPMYNTNFVSNVMGFAIRTCFESAESTPLHALF